MTAHLSCCPALLHGDISSKVLGNGTTYLSVLWNRGGLILSQHPQLAARPRPATCGSSDTSRRAEATLILHFRNKYAAAAAACTNRDPIRLHSITFFIVFRVASLIARASLQSGLGDVPRSGPMIGGRRRDFCGWLLSPWFSRRGGVLLTGTHVYGTEHLQFSVKLSNLI